MRDMNWKTFGLGIILAVGAVAAFAGPAFACAAAQGCR